MTLRDTIMIVEDDSIIRNLLTQRLEDAGYAVTNAADAGEAVNQAVALRPRLILSDMQMPVWGTGGDLYLELRKRPELQTLPMIFITAFEFARIKERYPMLFTDPKVRMLSKPINWVMLEQAIQELIGESKSLPKTDGK